MCPSYQAFFVRHFSSSIGTPISAIMSAPVVSVDSKQSVDTCMNLMTDRHLRHLPVVEDGQLLGLLSIGDLVKAAIAEQAELISNWNSTSAATEACMPALPFSRRLTR